MSRAARYLREMEFAWRCADDPRSRVALSLSTLAFHTGNLLHRPISAAPRGYSVRLADATRHLWLRTYGGDLFVFYEVLLDRCYRLPRSLAAPRTIVDLGANVGLTTLFYAAEYPDSRIICVEPDPSNVALLRHNVQSLGSRATVVEAAVAARSGSVSFRVGAGSWGGFVSNDEGDTKKITATTVSEIRRLHDLEQIDLLKVDIEGSERDVFADCSEWIRAVSTIIIELHGAYSLAAFRRDLATSGLEVLEPCQMNGETAMIVASRPVQ